MVFAGGAVCLHDFRLCAAFGDGRHSADQLFHDGSIHYLGIWQFYCLLRGHFCGHADEKTARSQFLSRYLYLSANGVPGHHGILYLLSGCP